jgi:hypothetical protein
MPSDAPGGLVLIVTGSTLRAEEGDRPLAYYLKQAVETGLAEREAPQIRVRVVSDARWLHEEAFQVLPTLSIGGPGVSLLAKQWLDELPLALAVDERFCIQLSADPDESRASIWGSDNANTQIAVSAFQQRFLPALLDHWAEHASELASLDPEGATEDDDPFHEDD